MLYVQVNKDLNDNYKPYCLPCSSDDKYLPEDIFLCVYMLTLIKHR